MQHYLQAIEQEVNRAKALHSWNGITIQQAILNLAEECGEAVRALNNITEGDGTKAELVIELVQTAAMAIRTLELIEGYPDTKVTDFKVGDRVKVNHEGYHNLAVVKGFVNDIVTVAYSSNFEENISPESLTLIPNE